MKVTRKVKLATYNCVVHIIITDALNQEVNRIYKKHKSTEEFNDEAEGVVVTLTIENYYLILSTQYLTHNTVAHETYHIAVKVTEDRGITNEEAQAWLCGQVTAEVYKLIQNKKLIITNGKD